MDMGHVGCNNTHNPVRLCGECSDTKLIISNMAYVNIFDPGFEGSVGGHCAFLRVCSGRRLRNDSRCWADMLGSDKMVKLSVIVGELWVPKKLAFTIVFNLPLSMSH